MTRSEKFSPVLRIAELKKRDRARVAANTKRKLAEYEKKLDELRTFRNEYTFGSGSANQTMTASQLQERQRFIRQLDEGINFLTGKVEGQKQSSALDKQAWLDAHKHSDSMDKLMAKIRIIEVSLCDVREANELDEHSQHRKIRY